MGMVSNILVNDASNTNKIENDPDQEFHDSLVENTHKTSKLFFPHQN